MLAHRHRVGRRGDAGDRAGEEAAAASATAAATASAAVFRNRSGTLRRPGAAAAAASAGAIADEGQRHFDFAVLRERLGALHVEPAARAIDAIVAGPQRAGRTGHVAEQEVAGVDEQVAVALTGNREAPQDRFRERILDRLAFARVRAARAERHVRLHQHDARSHALERDDLRAGAGSAIESDVVRAEARGQAHRHQEFGVELRDFEEERAGAIVPVHREIAVDLLHARDAFVDRTDAASRGLAAAARRARRLRPARAVVAIRVTETSTPETRVRP